MSFDELIRDPLTVTTPSSSPFTLFWAEITYIPENILKSLAVNFSYSHLTPIQQAIFSKIESSKKLYNVISPPNTGTTTALVVLSGIMISNYQRPSVLWIMSNYVNLQTVYGYFQKLCPGVTVSIDTSNDNADVFLLLHNKAINRKTEMIVQNFKDRFKMVVFDCADDILSSQVNRSTYWEKVLKLLYSNQIGSLPCIYFTQLGNGSTHVSTYIKELDSQIQKEFKIYVSPDTVESPLNDTLRLVPQYFLQVISSTKIANKLFGNTLIRLKKGALLFGNRINLTDFTQFQYSEIESIFNEEEINSGIDCLRNGSKKFLIFSMNLQKKIKSCGIGAVIQFGLPKNGNEIDLQEYRNRVERAYSPGFIGVSIIVCQNDDLEDIKKLKNSLNINIEILPS